MAVAAAPARPPWGGVTILVAWAWLSNTQAFGTSWQCSARAADSWNCAAAVRPARAPVPSTSALSAAATQNAQQQTATTQIPLISAPALSMSAAAPRAVSPPAAAPPEPAAESPWVLPEEWHTRYTREHLQPVRQRGYLDTPETIAAAGRRFSDRDEARVHEGLAWNYCGPRPAPLGPLTPAPPPPAAVTVEADSVTYDRQRDLAQLRGAVEVSRGSQRLVTEALDWDRARALWSSDGSTLLDYPGLRVVGRDARLQATDGSGRIAAAHYRFSGALNARGFAREVEVLDPRTMRLRDIDYTTCPPGAPAWSLQARQLELSQDTGRGVAHHARLRLLEVPVFYTPYLSFPLDDRRQTGWLWPSAGSSAQHGLELTLPYYFNIAPPLDATLTMRAMSARGVLVSGELRYLTPADRGLVQFELIPQDERYQDGSRARGAFQAREQGHFGRWSTTLDYSVVSDERYLEDFGDSLQRSSTRRLTQRAEANYAGDAGWLWARVETFQTLDPSVAPAARPYGRLPQLLWHSREFALTDRARAQLRLEYTYFDHRHRVHGQRWVAQPRLTWTLAQRPYGHLRMGGSGWLTHYELTDPAPGQPRAPSQALPSVDLDGKLIFERTLSWQGQPALHTLEPRLFYLYTPYRAQDKLPVFDSAALDFDFVNLFRRNRFTGYDRVGDANQVTLGLTSRILASGSGSEWLRVSVGQIRYLADRRVQLGAPVAARDRSPIAGEWAVRLAPNWYARAFGQWDPDSADTVWPQRALWLQYFAPAQRRLFNVAYRYDFGTGADDRYEDTDISWRWPAFNGRAEIVGRWLYSLLHDRTMEALAGVEFGSCCWRLRFLGRHFKNRPESAGSTSVLVQLELTGLGAIGNSIEQLLAREIHSTRID